MSQAEKPAFSDRKLLVGEMLQYYCGRYRWGAWLVNRTTGSEHDFYKQLLWIPRFKIKGVHIASAVTVPGAPEAKGPAKDWKDAALLSIPAVALDDFNFELETSRQAVAYRSAKVWHVGIAAAGETIFSVLPEETGLDTNAVAVSVRRGGGNTDFTLGKFDVEQEKFISVSARIGMHLLVAETIPSLHPEGALV